MFLFTFYRIIKFALQGFWRNFWLSVVTITVIVLSVVSMNFLIIINRVTESAAEVIKERIDVSIYFKNTIEEEDVLRAKNYIDSLSQVRSVEYVSKEDALDNFKNIHKNDVKILEALDELEINPFAATLVVKANDIGDYEKILEYINTSEHGENILDKNFGTQRENIEKIQNISANVMRFGVVVSVIFIIIAILIVFNTIKLAIYAQREEIGVMKLVGASNTFISMPYLVEGVLYALFGCIIAFLLLIPLINFLQPYITNFFAGDVVNIRGYFHENIVFIFGSQLGAIIVLNIIASGIAVRRYLKV